MRFFHMTNSVLIMSHLIFLSALVGLKSRVKMTHIKETVKKMLTADSSSLMAHVSVCVCMCLQVVTARLLWCAHIYSCMYKNFGLMQYGGQLKTYPFFFKSDSNQYVTNNQELAIVKVVRFNVGMPWTYIGLRHISYFCVHFCFQGQIVTIYS